MAVTLGTTAQSFAAVARHLGARAANALPAPAGAPLADLVAAHSARIEALEMLSHTHDKAAHLTDTGAGTGAD